MKLISSTFLGILLAMGVMVQANAQPFLTNGLVAYYPLNGNANDASGNGHDGYAENTSTTSNQFGIPNAALKFSGDSWIFIPFSEAFATTNFSVSLMFNSQASFQDVSLLQFGAGEAPLDFYRGYELSTFDFNQHFGFWDFDGLSDYGPGKCGVPVQFWTQNRWYNVTFTQDGTNANLYVDGVLRASATNTTPYAPAQSSPIYIGSTSSGTSDPAAIPAHLFTGKMCEVYFFNRGLSPSEVHQLYLHEAGPLLDLVKAVKPEFNNLSLGTNYQLQISGDLNTWTNVGSSFVATNTTMMYPQYWDVQNWNQLNFRLQVVP